MKIIEVKLPCGRLIKLELTSDLKITEVKDKIFMLIEGKKIDS